MYKCCECHYSFEKPVIQPTVFSGGLDVAACPNCGSLMFYSDVVLCLNDKKVSIIKKSILKQQQDVSTRKILGIPYRKN